MKKTISASLVSAVLATAVGAYAAETDWPTRPVQVVVIANAGGDTDFNARTMAKYFTKLTGKAMVITNVAGGGGTLVAEQVKQAEPDGNTILFTHTGQLIVNEVAGLTEDSLDAFDICCIAGVEGTVFVASKSSGLKSLEDLISKSKAEPSSVTYGTEMGSYSHLQGLMFEGLTDTKLKMVDAGTVSEKVVALLGDRIDLAAISYGSVQDYVKSGDMVALGQPNEERNPLLGDVPTFKEQGVDFVMESLRGRVPGRHRPGHHRQDGGYREKDHRDAGIRRGAAQDLQAAGSYFGTNQSIDRLKNTRENFMKHKDELRQSK